MHDPNHSKGVLGGGFFNQRPPTLSICGTPLLSLFYKSPFFDRTCRTFTLNSVVVKCFTFCSRLADIGRMLHVTGILFLFLLLHTVHESCARSATWMCINNCAQCKRTYGAFFEGQRCAESCIKYRGLLMPDCNDISTISGFLNKLE
ncbi:eclosion hormone [Caerostris darwini]|uniref:Eclosion hormone n=1 Tax=Caerostris darwini TaxID=1538125 RepID=A0AAV4PH79_9ARAC|nr:eclosion hormone [Caerostris darwini]